MTAVIKKLNKRTRAKNAAFRKMTPDQRRVCIAKDVLEALKLKKITPTSGIYLDITSKKTVTKEADGDRDLSDLLPSVKCNVCAIGAIFVCAVIRNDELPIGKGMRWNRFDADDYKVPVQELGFDEHGYVSKFFSASQRSQIEMAFEKWTFFSRGGDSSATAYFTDEKPDPKQRMVLIMESIVAEGGTFRPKKLHEQLTAPSRR